MTLKFVHHLFVTVCLLVFAKPVMAQELSSTVDDQPPATMPALGDRLTDAQVTAFAELALAGIHTEYPNKPGNVVVDATSVRTPRNMHPAFYGCFDWHSSVHGHWMLVRLLKQYPDCTAADRIRDALATNLTADHLSAEADYFAEAQHKTFERTYGWAWYLKLVAELETWGDPQGGQWREHLRPLEELLVERTIDYLPKLSHPIRTGVHPDSGFGLALILDYAMVVENESLAESIRDRAKFYYLDDENYPAHYEPSGQDFFSSGLNEADLMRRVLPADEFSQWLTRFLPGLNGDDADRLFVPAVVSDVTDGYIVHLAGLNLSRAWCMDGIAAALPADDQRAKLLRESAVRHADAGFQYVFSGHYEGEHWLATFAVYLQSRAGLKPITDPAGP